MYTALYREHRPEVFDEILGQEHIVKILKNQINTDSVSHAYLFCGTRGTGKTTTARILAKGLNCTSERERPCGTCDACVEIKDGTFLDVVEIDAASNNGVDNIRELRESVKYPPAVGRKKVYIIDEVHMLSTGAFNALLKTLEEPPEYVVFILATTEPQKLPATVLSRCMRLDFRRVPEKVIIAGMADICDSQGIEVTEDALRVIAANADGSVRDGLSILDQCISGGDKHVGVKDVLEFLGASGEETFSELTDLVRKGKTADAILLLSQVLSDGKDVRQFMRDWVNHYRNLLLLKFIKNPEDAINLSAENIERLSRQSDSLDLEEINLGILELSKTIREARWSTQPRILLELVIVRLSSVISMAAVPEIHLKQNEPQKAVRVSDEHPEKTETKEANRDVHSVESKNGDSCKNSENTPLEKEKTQETPSGEDHEKPSFDYDKIWNDVFEEGQAEKGSLYIIGSSARLASIDERTFVISVKSDHVKKHTENNRELLERLMAKHTGAERAMKVVMDDAQAGDKAVNVEEIARNASETLGIDIEIE